MKYWTPDHSHDPMDAVPDTPATAPSGDLSEPPRRPPTAIATSASGPAPRPHRLRRSARMSRVEEAVNAVLDVLDGIGDLVRTAAARALR